MKLKEALELVISNPRKKAIRLDIGLLYFDPTFDTNGLRIHHNENVSGMGFGIGVFSVTDVVSEAHQVVDVDFQPFQN